MRIPVESLSKRQSNPNPDNGISRTQTISVRASRQHCSTVLLTTRYSSLSLLLRFSWYCLSHISFCGISKSLGRLILTILSNHERIARIAKRIMDKSAVEIGEQACRKTHLIILQPLQLLRQKSAQQMRLSQLALIEIPQYEV